MKDRILLALLAVMLGLSMGLVGCGGDEVPEITEYNLTISSTEGGSVATPGQGTESFTYDEGKVVDLVAVAEEGYYFVNWSGSVGAIADVNNATTTITMDGDYSITANFQLSVPTSILENPQGYPEDPSLTPEYGGTLKILDPRVPVNLGAYWMGVGGWNQPQSRFALEKLLGLNEDGELVPQLATNWTIDEPSKTITLTLREGVKFHDETDFNADAVKWCLDMYREAVQFPFPELDLVESLDVIGEYEVRLTLSEWDPLLIRNMSVTAGIIVSPTAAQENGDDAQWIPVGTGPFKFVSYEPGVRVTYERFDDYWQEGLPYLDGVVIEYVTDPEARLAALLEGEGDVINEFSASGAVNLTEQGYEVVSRVVHIKGIAGDIKNPESPFYDIRVRQAMAYAIPTAQIVADVFEGQYTSTNELALPGLTGWDSTIEGYPYNPDKARELMEAAGYSTTHRVSAKLTYSDDLLADYFAVLQDYLADIYIDINPVPLATYRGYINNAWAGEPGTMVEYQFSYNDLELPYTYSLTMSLSPEMVRFANIVTPEEYDALYESILAETDPGEREEMYKQINKMAIDDYCLVLPQFGFAIINARQADVHDFGWGVCATEFLPEMAWLGE